VQGNDARGRGWRPLGDSISKVTEPSILLSKRCHAFMSHMKRREGQGIDFPAFYKEKK
jgi:hypothetical protein